MRDFLPLVSVIIPLFNQAEYIESSIKSVLNQSYKNIEIIIVNDGSIDNYKTIIQPFLNIYNNIFLIEQENLGLSVARNNGILSSKGEYILPLDADDLIKTTMIEECVEKIKQDKSDIVFTDVYYFENDDRYIQAKENIVLDDLKYNNGLSYCSLYKKNIWKKIGGYSDSMSGGYEDWEFWINAKKMGFKFSHIAKDLFLYRVKTYSMFQDALKKDKLLKSKIILNNQDIFSKNEINSAINLFKNDIKKDRLYFYCKKDILEENIVLLYGGYSGYQNFGDILQAKWAIEYHKKNTGLKPVLICDIHSISDNNSLKSYYNKFNIEDIIFYSFIPYDLSKLELKEVENASIKYFHNYGGGIINRFWAKWYFFLLENLCNYFNIKNIILTGQQIDPLVADKLKQNLSKLNLEYFGTRDQLSFEAMQKTKIEKLFFIFDDAFEKIYEISNIFNLKKMERQQVFFHFNISSYTKNEFDPLSAFENVIKLIRRKFDSVEIVLVVAFEDMREADVIDTLSVVKLMEERFDFIDCKIINLAKISLQNIPFSIDINENAIFISSSYHVAMLVKILGLKTYLFHFNDYYNQKRNGLDIKEEDIESFLNDNSIDKNFYIRKKSLRDKIKNLKKCFLKSDKKDFLLLKKKNIGFRFIYKKNRENIHKIIYNKDSYINYLENIG